MLRHFEQKTNTETARMLGLSVAAASNRYVRALKRLRPILLKAPGVLGHLSGTQGQRTSMTDPDLVPILSRSWPKNSLRGTAGGTAEPDRIRRKPPRALGRDPRGLSRSRGRRRRQPSRRGPRVIAKPADAGRPLDAGTAGRFPHHGRNRPRRYGRRVRGGSGVARAPGCLKGAAPGPWPIRPRSNDFVARHALLRPFTIPTSCPSLGSAKMPATTFMRCS